MLNLKNSSWTGMHLIDIKKMIERLFSILYTTQIGNSGKNYSQILFIEQKVLWLTYYSQIILKLQEINNWYGGKINEKANALSNVKDIIIKFIWRNKINLW